MNAKPQDTNKRDMRDDDFLRDILKGIVTIRQYLPVTVAHSEAHTIVWAELIAIGRAIKKLSTSLKNSYPSFSWDGIAKTCTGKTHDQAPASLAVIQSVIKNYLSALEKQVTMILEKTGASHG